MIVTATNRDQADELVARVVRAMGQDVGHVDDCEQMPQGHLHYFLTGTRAYLRVWSANGKLRHRWIGALKSVQRNVTKGTTTMTTAKVTKRQAAAIKRANKARMTKVDKVTAKRTAARKPKEANGTPDTAKQLTEGQQTRADALTKALEMMRKGATLAEMAKASGRTENALRHAIRAYNPTTTRDKERGVVFTLPKAKNGNGATQGAGK